jgi:hypothetical protein
MATSNKRLERTRHERPSLVGCVGEPLKRSVMLLTGAMNQPRIQVEITFLSSSESSRNAPSTNLSDGKYRPHLVVGDPNQRKALLLATLPKKHTWV